MKPVTPTPEDPARVPIHPVVKAWIDQLLSEDMASLVDRDGQIEVRLFANRGKVNKTPVIVLNHGPSSLS